MLKQMEKINVLGGYFARKPSINSTFLQDKVGGKYITVLNVNCLIKGILIIQREIFISCFNISE